MDKVILNNIINALEKSLNNIPKIKNTPSIDKKYFESYSKYLATILMFAYHYLEMSCFLDTMRKLIACLCNELTYEKKLQFIKMLISELLSYLKEIKQ